MGLGNTILVVDDIAFNRELLRSILDEQYCVLEAENGQEALDILEVHSDEIEGIILDLIMPVMDGYTFLERYSAVERWQNIPVLVATADEGAEVENRCLKLGAWDFVHKPYNPATVYLRIQNNISRSQLNLLERQRIIDVFRHYEDPAILEQLLKKDVAPEELRGKTVEIAVLFVDIRGFTALSERLAPQVILEVLNEYLMLTSSSIKKYGGTLDKFIGDCTMAFWGAPQPCEDGVYQACRAAVDMIRKTNSLSVEMERLFGYEVRCGVGLHVGPAVVGNIGTPERMDYTAIGDTVNTASRLESNAPAGKIYISRAVAQRLGDRAKTTSLGLSPLKGKAAGFEILTLDSLDMEETGEGTDQTGE